MTAHRSSPGRVPNLHPSDNFRTSDNFRPADAIESLHAAILRIETIAQVASDAVDQLPCPSEPGARRAFARMQILVSKAVDEASAALAQGDQLLAELSQHMQDRSERIQHARQLDG